MNSKDIDRELPWGYWLELQSAQVGHTSFVDRETGEDWPTLRHAFWRGRLGMPNINGEPPPAEMERLHAILAAAARRTMDATEATDDLFDGSRQFASMYHMWLSTTGLLKNHKLTDEGWSALAMLHATRKVHLRAERPSSATVAQLSELLGPEDREARLRRVEQEAAKWDVNFYRDVHAGRPAVILSVRTHGPVPAMKRIWEIGFANVEQRDRFYDWLCHRLDRWPFWCATVSDFGAGSLTHSLLVAMAASMVDGP